MECNTSRSRLYKLFFRDASDKNDIAAFESLLTRLYISIGDNSQADVHAEYFYCVRSGFELHEVSQFK
ncbi:uncharacterized protein PHALS_00605 [Plasmopara halstedii]|uniref:Uncharacterized protein n=1 Tax=Plasmopara halstedii TaxID=4781 RepID=A0A0P1B6L8_PLAHL|nr:uncharacterized protein PHALS_00605 [Plasmopara halstedii]CEG50461.1 hypothetical protein PHALS_00605 [Plasmopara halstedii]|eukprot:XP_024586830.1 hypothetical protein PHALS_00605 [Plasmopara halstedii]